MALSATAERPRLGSMAPPRAPRARRRTRPGSLERPVNARSYRGTWLLAGIPLLIAAFSIHPWPEALTAPSALLPAFDEAAAVRNADALAQQFPDRRPGTTGASQATEFVAAELERYGYKVARDRFETTLAGLGTRTLVNLTAEAPGRTRDAILVLAHRDDLGIDGLNDNASGTATLLELARAFGTQPGVQTATPNHTIVFVSTDGGAYGAAGAARVARQELGHRQVVAAISLDANGGEGPVRVVLASDSPSSPDATLVSTARRAVDDTDDTFSLDQASPAHQLLDLAFPYSLYEQAPFTARGMPAIALTTAGDRPPGTGAGADDLSKSRLNVVGHATESLVAALDASASSSTATRTYIAFGDRILGGWAVQLLLLTALLPALVAIVDLFARCRRRGLDLAPAFRALRARTGFWLWTLAVFELLAVLHLFPYGAPRPVALETTAATEWPLLPLTLLGIASAAGWLAAREGLIPRGPVTRDDELAGETAALLGLVLLTVVVVTLNRYALLFVLPSLHAWIWLPQLRSRPRWLRGLVFLAGFAGPLWLVHAFATRLALGLDAPWYLMELAVVHYVSFPLLIVFAGWLAVAAQLATLTAGRYAPYPRAGERPRRGPVRMSAARLADAGRVLGSGTAPRTRKQAVGE